MDKAEDVRNHDKGTWIVVHTINQFLDLCESKEKALILAEQMFQPSIVDLMKDFAKYVELRNK